ncbi:MAG: DUF423 domain-containing protein [Leeuwenhoekiella sp.]
METILLAQLSGAILGGLGITLGAFGAHLLKKKVTEEKLASFETGVKYQMYHALLLLVLGFNLNFNTDLDNLTVYLILMGTLLFSFSIYGLTLLKSGHPARKALGPITPLGGLLLLGGWLCLGYGFIKDLI